MSTTTMTRKQIEARVAELEGTAPALVGSDEGTHPGPATYRVYERIDGTRYCLRNFAGAVSSTSEELAERDTDGRMRSFPQATASIRRAAAELKRLKLELR